MLDTTNQNTGVEQSADNSLDSLVTPPRKFSNRLTELVGNHEKLFKKLNSLGLSLEQIKETAVLALRIRDNQGTNKIAVLNPKDKRAPFKLDADTVRRLNIQIKDTGYQIIGIRILDSEKSIAIFNNPETENFAISIIKMENKSKSEIFNSRNLRRSIENFSLSA